MEYLQVVFLGIVQGIAEFLPISSSGHLVLVEALFGMHHESLALNVALHVGTLLSISLVYRHQILALLHQPRLLLAIVVATIPIVIVGLCLHDELKQTFSSPLIAGCCLLVTASLLWSTQRIDRGEKSLEEISLRDALIVGLFQTIAPLPGISRSGVTIVGGLVAGLSRRTAADFSFLIALPAIGGAATLESLEMLQTGTNSRELWQMAIGAGVAFVVGVVALRWLLSVVAARKLHLFAGYCAVVGTLAIIVALLM